MSNQNSFLSTIPYIAQLVSAFISGQTADIILIGSYFIQSERLPVHHSLYCPAGLRLHIGTDFDWFLFCPIRTASFHHSLYCPAGLRLHIGADSRYHFDWFIFYPIRTASCPPFPILPSWSPPSYRGIQQISFTLHQFLTITPHIFIHLIYLYTSYIYTPHCHMILSKQKCCLLSTGVSTESQKRTSVLQLRQGFLATRNTTRINVGLARSYVKLLLSSWKTYMCNLMAWYINK